MVKHEQECLLYMKTKLYAALMDHFLIRFHLSPVQMQNINEQLNYITEEIKSE